MGSPNGLFTVDPSFDVHFDWNSGAVLDAEFGLLTISVPSYVHAIGFDFDNPIDPPGNASTVTIDGQGYSGFSQPNFLFYGIVSNAPIGPITIDFNGGLGILDDVTTAVPEPSSWVMMMLGFIALGSMAWRRHASGSVGAT